MGKTGHRTSVDLTRSVLDETEMGHPLRGTLIRVRSRREEQTDREARRVIAQFNARAMELSNRCDQNSARARCQGCSDYDQAGKTV